MPPKSTTLDTSAIACILHGSKGEKQGTLRRQTQEITTHSMMSQTKNSVYPSAQQQCKQHFKISRITLQKLCLWWPKTLFVCEWKAKTSSKSSVFQKCPCWQSQEILYLWHVYPQINFFIDSKDEEEGGGGVREENKRTRRAKLALIIPKREIQFFYFNLQFTHT